jgi:membrane-anchored protein YejM (alkaline phosphatase superfamily)
MILAETPRRKLVTQLVNWGHWFALLNIIIAVTIAAIYILNSPAPGSAIGTFYLFTNWLSHIGFLTFFGFVILILPLCYLVPNAKAVKTLSSVLAALGLALLAFDALLYNKYGVHLSLNSAELIRTETQTAIAQFGWQQWGFLLLLFVVWLSFQLIVANALWQRIDRLQKRKLGLPIGAFFVGCFVISHALHVWADAKLYQPIVQQDNMFPLSYPATAKTLMAKYSLLDIEDYQQRKALQFNQTIKGIIYPAEPVYCSVDNSKKVLLLSIVKGELPSSIAGLSKFEHHYLLESSIDNGITTVLFGLPELYHSALKSYSPLLLQLPRNMGLSVSVYLDNNSDSGHSGLAPYQKDWQQFKQEVIDTSSNLSIGFVQAEQLDELLTENILAQYQIIVTTLVEQNALKNSLLSNITINKAISSLEDIAPTALNLLGCAAQAKAYSTGNTLTQKGNLNYIVSTQGSKVLLLTNNQKIEIMKNGNVRVFDLNTGEEAFSQVDPNILSQGIKHLSRFSAKRSIRPL